MDRIFVIGDIHGCAKTFKKLLKEVLKVTKEDSIYLLGDYIDRGPNSKKVVNRIIKMKENGYKIFPIMGNHELLLIDSINVIENHVYWFQNGAKQTLASFEINYAYELKPKYIEFFQNLPYYYILDNFIIVHGGLNFNIDDPFQDKESMVWIRENNVDLQKTGGRRLITGHTPMPLDKIQKSLSKNKINLDGGCVYYNKHSFLGYLVALELNTMQLYFQRNIENNT